MNSGIGGPGPALIAHVRLGAVDAPPGAHAPSTLGRPHLYTIATDRRARTAFTVPPTLSSSKQRLKRTGGTRVKRPSSQDSYVLCPTPQSKALLLGGAVDVGPHCYLRLCERWTAQAAAEVRGRCAAPPVVVRVDGRLQRTRAGLDVMVLCEIRGTGLAGPALSAESSEFHHYYPHFNSSLSWFVIVPLLE